MDMNNSDDFIILMSPWLYVHSYCLYYLWGEISMKLALVMDGFIESA